MKYRLFPMLLCAMAAVTASPSRADIPDVRHGVLGASGPELEGGLVTTYQRTLNGEALEEGAASVDLLMGLPFGSGTLTVYLEGSTTPHANAVTARFPDANNDVGTALDDAGNGRLQISELHYDFRVGSTWFFFGLLNPAGFIDTSVVANDESRQFLNKTLVNNPTLQRPDYAVGAALHHEARAGRPGATLLLTGSHGLVDNLDRSYSQLADLDADGKGLFAAAELYWELGDLMPRLGVWTRTADHGRLDGSADPESNAGVYATVDGESGDTRWNLRMGMANPRVSPAAWFMGAALERPVGAAVMGLGVTHTAVSPDWQESEPQRDDTTQAEIYFRFEPDTHWQITPSLQYAQNPAFEGGSDTWVAGLRLSAAF